jgi:hypothetical protein
MLIGIFMIMVGLFLLFASVFARRVRAALSRGQWQPVGFGHRAALFLVGATAFLDGLIILYRGK